MKRIFTLLLLAAAFVACSDDKDDATSGKTQVISFEPSTLVDKAGNSVAVGEIEVSNGISVVKHANVFWAKGYADNGSFDGILFTTKEDGVKCGSYYSQDPQYGDFWGGFVLSASYDKTTVEPGNYSKQFAVWALKGASSSATCMVGYDCSYTGGPAYALPTIEFAEPCAVNYLCMANTVITYSYAPVNVDSKEYYYKVVVIGSLNGKETGKAECMLVNGSSRVADWTRVSLKKLGTVDRLTFKPETNDVNSCGPVAPTYFAVDDLCISE